jgi:hypothetical protein
MPIVEEAGNGDIFELFRHRESKESTFSRRVTPKHLLDINDDLICLAEHGSTFAAGIARPVSSSGVNLLPRTRTRALLTAIRRNLFCRQPISRPTGLALKSCLWRSFQHPLNRNGDIGRVVARGTSSA